MIDWPPYFVNGVWDRTAVVARQSEISNSGSIRPHNIDLLSTPLPARFIEQFETLCGITLPNDYKHFLLSVGDGGKGPGTLRGLGAPTDDGLPWQPDEIVTTADQAWDIPMLAEPFLLTEAWNDLSLDDKAYCNAARTQACSICSNAGARCGPLS